MQDQLDVLEARLNAVIPEVDGMLQGLRESAQTLMNSVLQLQQSVQTEREAGTLLAGQVTRLQARIAALEEQQVPPQLGHGGRLEGRLSRRGAPVAPPGHDVQRCRSRSRSRAPEAPPQYQEIDERAPMPQIQAVRRLLQLNGPSANGLPGDTNPLVYGSGVANSVEARRHRDQQSSASHEIRLRRTRDRLVAQSHWNLARLRPCLMKEPYRPLMEILRMPSIHRDGFDSACRRDIVGITRAVTARVRLPMACCAIQAFERVRPIVQSWRYLSVAARAPQCAGNSDPAKCNVSRAPTCSRHTTATPQCMLTRDDSPTSVSTPMALGSGRVM